MSKLSQLQSKDKMEIYDELNKLKLNTDNNIFKLQTEQTS